MNDYRHRLGESGRTHFWRERLSMTVNYLLSPGEAPATPQVPITRIWNWRLHLYAAEQGELRKGNLQHLLNRNGLSAEFPALRDLDDLKLADWIAARLSQLEGGVGSLEVDCPYLAVVATQLGLSESERIVLAAAVWLASDAYVRGLTYNLEYDSLSDAVRILQAITRLDSETIRRSLHPRGCLMGTGLLQSGVRLPGRGTLALLPLYGLDMAALREPVAEAWEAFVRASTSPPPPGRRGDPGAGGFYPSQTAPRSAGSAAQPNSTRGAHSVAWPQRHGQDHPGAGAGAIRGGTFA